MSDTHLSRLQLLVGGELACTHLTVSDGSADQGRSHRSSFLARPGRVDERNDVWSRRSRPEGSNSLTAATYLVLHIYHVVKYYSIMYNMVIHNTPMSSMYFSFVN